VFILSVTPEIGLAATFAGLLVCWYRLLLAWLSDSRWREWRREANECKKYQNWKQAVEERSLPV